MDEALRQGRDLLDTAEAAIVTTIDQGGRPQTRAMFNLRNGRQFPKLRPFFADLPPFELWFTTNTASGKIRDLAGNAAASVYYCRPGEFRGLMLGGDFEVVHDDRDRHRLWQDGWEMYYPGGPTDPDHTVLRLRPTLAKYYHQLKTTVLIGAE